jgi:sugar phosphate isomerase/epimerase
MYKNLSLSALGHSMPFDEVCALATSHGFAGVELDLEFLQALGSPQAAADWFASTGLLAGGFALSTPWGETATDEAFGAALDTVAIDATYAAALGCKRCFTWVPPCSATLDYYQHFDLVVPRLIRIAEVLAAHGAMLGFGFFGPLTMRDLHVKDFVHTLDGARSFAAAIGMHSLNTGVVLDSFHWHASHGSIREIELLDHHEVVSVQLNDAVLGLSVDEQRTDEVELVGATGVINVEGFLGALRTIGYTGPLTVATSSATMRAISPSEAAAAASKALDQVLQQEP